MQAQVKPVAVSLHVPPLAQGFDAQALTAGMKREYMVACGAQFE